MARLLGDVTQPNVLSRFLNLAVAIELIIDSVINLNTKLREGTLMGKMGSGNYRPYFESETSVDFADTSADFTLSEIAGQALLKNLRIGDVVEGIDGTALGTVLTYDPLTGVGTLAADATNSFTGNIRVDNADLDISKGVGLILKDEDSIGSDDVPAAAYFEGFFTTVIVLGATAQALIDLEAKVISSSEFRLI